VIFNKLDYPEDIIRFNSKYSGKLAVTRDKEFLTLDFPADPPTPIELTEQIISCFDLPVISAFKGKTDYLLVFENESRIRDLKPDFNNIRLLGDRGVIVTAAGKNTDFVSRFFAPQSGINEDPVTGSAHTTLTPYWSAVLGKKTLSAEQLSERTGQLICKLHGDRMLISGKARLYLSGSIQTS
jgi:predicted PhzF superfamily epimerase YddE/YHI9